MVGKCNVLKMGHGKAARMLTHGRLLSTVALMIGAPGAALAQEAVAAPVGETPVTEATSSRDEIVVSAKREGVSVLTISSSVSVLGSEEIEKLGITNTQDLQARVPNLVTSLELGIPKVFIRGIGQEATTSGQEPGVATNVDGVYVGRAIQAFATEIDLDRVEVMRGPQGTLYGRNATAGTINYYTKKATSDFQVGANVGGGNLGSYKFGGFVNGQLGEGFNARIAAGFSHRDGYVLNAANGDKLDSYQVVAGHAAFNFEPNSEWEFNLSLEGQSDQSNGPSFLNLNAPNPVLLPGAVEGRDYVISNGRAVTIEGPAGEKLFTKRSGAAATLTTDWTPGEVRVRSITAYRHSLHRQQNADPTIFAIINTAVRTSGDQFSQEFNVSGVTGPVDYVVGALYYHEVADEIDHGVIGYPAVAFVSPFLGVLGGIDYGIHQITDSYAGFGDVTVKVADHFRLLAGLRYTHDKKSVTQYNYYTYPTAVIDLCRPDAFQAPGTPGVLVKNSIGFSKLTGRVGAEADISEHSLAYATASRGYKAGGFSDFAGCGPTFKPESVDSYEIGLKGSAFDRRFTYSASAFWMDYSNLQTQFATVAGTTTINAKAARIKGVELELTAQPAENLSLDANVSYLDAKYRNFLSPFPLDFTLTPLQLAGQQMPRSPKWSGGAGIEYAQPLGGGATLSARVEGYFTSNYSFNPASYDANARAFGAAFTVQDGYVLGNAYLTYKSGENGHLIVRGFVKNFTNKFYLTSSLVYPILGNVSGFAAPPRTWGIELVTRF
jgi:iron complex outermembrane receptor protein